MVCKKIGEPDPDVAGIGILISFSVQTFMSLALSIWVFFLTSLGRLSVNHEKGSREYDVEIGRLRLVEKCMMTGFDVQLLLGTALIIFALGGIHQYDTYHLRLIYDLVSFVGVGCAACSITWTYTTARVSKYKSMRRGPKRVSRWSPRHRALYIFAILFVVFVILFGIRLGEWNDEEEGLCYRTNSVASRTGQHPSSDIVYLSITSLWMMIVLLTGALGNETKVRSVIIGAALQYPIHLYFMIAVRSANTNHLEGSESEADWRFGQTTAVVLLRATIVELLSGIEDYVRFERKVKANEPISDDPESTGDVRSVGGVLGFAVETATETGKRIIEKQRSRGELRKPDDVDVNDSKERITVTGSRKQSTTKASDPGAKLAVRDDWAR